MKQYKLDYTNTFYALTYDIENLLKESTPLFARWIKKWKHQLTVANITYTSAQQQMQKVNPVIIPRNHLIEKVIKIATTENNLEPVIQLNQQLRKPYSLSHDDLKLYQTIPQGFDDTYKTFCGT